MVEQAWMNGVGPDVLIWILGTLTPPAHVTPLVPYFIDRDQRIRNGVVSYDVECEGSVLGTDPRIPAFADGLPPIGWSEALGRDRALPERRDTPQAQCLQQGSYPQDTEGDANKVPNVRIGIRGLCAHAPRLLSSNHTELSLNIGNRAVAKRGISAGIPTHHVLCGLRGL